MPGKNWVIDLDILCDGLHVRLVTSLLKKNSGQKSAWLKKSPKKFGDRKNQIRISKKVSLWVKIKV